MALAVAQRGTCLRRRYGAVITDRDMTKVVSTGYAGSPRGTANCIDRGTCLREEPGAAPGSRYELCRSVHAEINAVVHAERRDTVGGRLLLAGVEQDTGAIKPDGDLCQLCRRAIINAGIAWVHILRTADEVYNVSVETDWVAKGPETLPVDPSAWYWVEVHRRAGHSH